MSPGHSHVAVTLALGDLLLGCGVEGSFSPPSTSPLDRAFPTCVFSAALASAGWMLVHQSLPWRHSQISPDPGPFCLLEQMGLSLEQGWDVSTHHRRQIPSNRLLLRCEPQGCAYGCGHLLPGGSGAHRGLGKGLSSLLVALEGSRHLQGVQSRGGQGCVGTQVGHCQPLGISTQLLLVLPSPGRAQPAPLGWQQQGQLLVASWESSPVCF